MAHLDFSCKFVRLKNIYRMNTQITQIALRLRGLRESINLTISDAAYKCGISPEEYEVFESGTSDIPMSFLCEAAEVFGVETTALISGEEPHATAFFITRRGTGIGIERNKAYKYRSLAHGFKHARAEPFEVTVAAGNQAITLNTHAGQEFNMILEGSMQLQIGDNDLILHEGDCIYFDASRPHGMKALNGKKVRFLAMII
jgi:mannose-6-phosphate isomerase-like protein (cupin superfamily)